jgi:hypothetical protein
MPPRLLLVISTVAIALAAGCGTTVAGSKGSDGSNGLSSKSGKQIVAAAVAATTRQSSFHFVETSGAGSSTEQIVADVGSGGGEQQITVTDGTQSSHVTVLLSKGTAYFTGDAVGLEGFTGLTEKLATQLAGKWISVPSSNAGFSSLAGSLVVKTAASRLVQLDGTISRGVVSSKLGRPAVPVKVVQSTSTGSLALTMYVSTTGAALPILIEGTTKATGSSARSVSARFSDWGEALHLSAPKNSISVSAVKALAG